MAAVQKLRTGWATAPKKGCTLFQTTVRREIDVRDEQQQQQQADMQRAIPEEVFTALTQESDQDKLRQVSRRCTTRRQECWSIQTRESETLLHMCGGKGGVNADMAAQQAAGNGSSA